MFLSLQMCNINGGQANINLSLNLGSFLYFFSLLFFIIIFFIILANCASLCFPNFYLKQKFLPTNAFGLKLTFVPTG